MKKYYSISLLVLALVGCNAKATCDASFNSLPIDIEIHSSLVKEYFAQEKYDYSDMDAHINGRTDQGDNLPINISWEVATDSKKKVEYVIEIREGDNIFKSFSTEETNFDFINYKLNTSYVISLTPRIGRTSYETKSLPVQTPNGKLRTITIDGVNNFRDLGDGVHLKQGLIYRSATFENNTVISETNPSFISEGGKKELGYLGLVSEIDLRKDSEKTLTDSSYVGLKYHKAQLHYGGQNVLTYKSSEYNNPETVKGIFEFLSEETNYPVNFHCVRGTDRTGMIAFLVKGLLGIEEESLYRDYLYSDFYNIGSPVKLENIYYSTNPDSSAKYVNVLKQAEGATLQEKIYNYLSSDKIGISKDKLDKIIDILEA